MIKMVSAITAILGLVSIFFAGYAHLNTIHDEAGTAEDVLSATLIILGNDQAGRLYWLKEKEKMADLDLVEKGRKAQLEQNLRQIEQMTKGK